jgi:glutathione S-transferase
MQLIGSPTSPFVRKVRVYLAETGIACPFTPVDAWQPDARLLAMAPLGKVPVLVRDDGSALFDSLLVIEYLDHTLPETRRLIPAAGEARWDVLRWQALAHGLIEATQARLLDARRPETQRSREVQAREEVRIARALEAVDKDVAGREWLRLDRLTLADVVLGVALQYIDFRYPHDWRAARPALAKWAARTTSRPSFASTLPPGFTPVA